jgi:membrane protein
MKDWASAVWLERGWRLIRDAALQWSRHNAPRLGAALAYYTVLSLAPMIILAVAACGFFFGDQAVRGQLYWQINQTVGQQSAAVVESLLTGIQRNAGRGWAGVFGAAVLLIGASGVFVELREALNYIWDTPPSAGSGVLLFIRDRFFSFAMVLIVGFLLALSLAASALAHVFIGGAGLRFPAPVLATGNFIVAFIVKAFLFALIYRVIPEVRIRWADVAIGATVTTVLFEAGAFLITFYLKKAGIGSAYGAAGSLVALLVWVYYSAQIFLYGAELTHVYALSRRQMASGPLHVPAERSSAASVKRQGEIGLQAASLD